MASLPRYAIWLRITEYIQFDENHISEFWGTFFEINAIMLGNTHSRQPHKHTRDVQQPTEVYQLYKNFMEFYMFMLLVPNNFIIF